MFLVDASKEMFIKGEDGEPSNFDMTMQVRWPLVFFLTLVFIFILVWLILAVLYQKSLCATPVGCAHCVHQ